MLNEIKNAEANNFGEVKYQKRLEFGHTFTSVYKNQGGLGVKNIFWNPNSKAFVSYNEKSLHVWNPRTEQSLFNINFFEETKSHMISCIVYSPTNQVSKPS